MIGKIGIATALHGFNDLGHSVTPTSVSKTRFYLQWSTFCLKMNKKWALEVEKISRFLSTGHRILPSFDCKLRETMVAKFQLVLSLQRSNCNILGLTDTVALLTKEARFFRFRVIFGACSFQKRSPWPPIFFFLPFWQK